MERTRRLFPWKNTLTGRRTGSAPAASGFRYRTCAVTAQKSRPEHQADRKAIAGYDLTHILIRIKRLCEPSDILGARDKDEDREEIVGEKEAEKERGGGAHTYFLSFLTCQVSFTGQAHLISHDRFLAARIASRIEFANHSRAFERPFD